MILFEGTKYNLVDENTIPCAIREYLKKDKLRCVGYYRHGGEMVFILPKSFMNAVSGDGEKRDQFDFKDYKDNKQVTNLSLWVYGAIDRYRSRISNTSVSKAIISDVIVTSKTDNHPTTLLDHIIALRNFFDRNKNLILMIYKEVHRGYNRINWAKTARKKTPIISASKQVAYTEVCNEKRHIHDQEQLMVLYFSTMRYVHIHYGIDMPTSPYYQLLGEGEFDALLENDMVLGRLNGIRQQYFSDKMCELWRLLYAFHQELSPDEHHRLTQQGNSDYKDEYLLATDFDRVFEDMIDYLISDPNLMALKKHVDNRRIDHIFLGQSLIDPDSKVYYIADSKYYDLGSDIDDISKAKQYDYAQNIIQMVRDRSNGCKDYPQIDKKIADSYYDPLSHGYTIMPNFFIRPMEIIRSEEKMNFKFLNKVEKRCQHKGCLFDRSTLFVLHYSINLSFVLKTYALDDTFERDKARKEISNQTEQDFKQHIGKEYSIISIPLPWQICKKHFHLDRWLGRTFYLEKKQMLIFAIPKPETKKKGKASS